MQRGDRQDPCSLETPFKNKYMFLAVLSLRAHLFVIKLTVSVLFGSAILIDPFELKRYQINNFQVLKEPSNK